MAPILATTPADVSAYATHTSPWLTWTLFVVVCLFGLVSTFMIARRLAPKAKQAVLAFIKRTQDKKMVLPTHLDPWTPREVVMPLPPTTVNEEADEEKECQEEMAVLTSDKPGAENFKELSAEQEQGNTTATAEEEEGRTAADVTSAAINGDDNNALSTSSASIRCSINLGIDDCELATGSHYSLHLQDDDLVDAVDLLVTPTLSPTLDSEPDTDISSIQTPPLNAGSSLDDAYPKGVAVNYDDDESADFFSGSLTPSTAFGDALCYACLDLDAPGDDSLVSSEAFSGSLDNPSSTSLADIPIIIITDDSDGGNVDYYHEPSMVSTPSTHAFYELETSSSMHSVTTCQAPSKSHAPIPINFAPTLPYDHYILVPLPGSNEYFYNPYALPTQEEELPTDLSRLGLWPTSDLIDTISDDWVLGSAPRRRSRTTISSVDDQQPRCFSAPPDEDQGSPTDLSRLGLRPTSDFSDVTSDDFILGSAPRVRGRIRTSCNNGDEEETAAGHVPAYLTGSEESPTDLLRLGLRPTSNLSDVTSKDSVQTMAPTSRGRSRCERNSLRGMQVQIGMGREAVNKNKARNASVGVVLNSIVEEGEEAEEVEEERREAITKDKIENIDPLGSLIATVTGYSPEKAKTSDKDAIGELDSIDLLTLSVTGHNPQSTTSTDLFGIPQMSPTQSRFEVSRTSTSKPIHSSFSLTHPLRPSRKRKDSGSGSPFALSSDVTPPPPARLTGHSFATPLKRASSANLNSHHPPWSKLRIDAHRNSPGSERCE